MGYEDYEGYKGLELGLGMTPIASDQRAIVRVLLCTTIMTTPLLASCIMYLI